MGRPMLPRIKQTCKHCGQIFEVCPREKGRPFCSRACYLAWKAAQRPRVKCAQCGKEFAISPAGIKERNFCSRDCVSQWMHENWKGKDAPQYKGTRAKTCPICKEEFECVNTNQKTCSIECAGKWRSKHHVGPNANNWKGGKVTVHCANCGKAIKRIRSELDRSENFFCDLVCRGEWQARNIVGENHPNWKGGWEYDYGPNCDKQRRKTRKRDGYRCQHCGKRQKKKDMAFDVHHIIPFRTFGYKPGENENYKKANRLTNLITLCQSCHKKAEWGTIPVQPKLL